MTTPVASTARAALLLVLLLPAGAGACDRGGSPAPPAAGGAAAPAGGDLSPFQLEHGIGPVTEPVTLGPRDHELAERGEEIFETKCAACHKLGERYVGPPLGDVLTRRSPAYVMNMILDPQEMYTRHPAAKELLGRYMTQMPNQGLTREQARAVVEYLRPQAPGDDD